jgi:long-chain acyl-CoA synthetase
MVSSPTKLILDHVYEHEASHAGRILFTQPIKAGQVVDYTWAEVLDQARRMAAHLRARGFPRGARIAILSKNCAHFIMAELAVWIAGYTTVAIFPTERSATVRYVLDHSEASLLFVGKLDTWEEQRLGVPEGLPCIAFPLAPPSTFETWGAITARTDPEGGWPQRHADEIAFLLYTSGSTGQPKGVMSSFRALSAAGEGIATDTRRRIGPDRRNRMLSYLPLAHSFERSWVEALALVDGNTHVFFSESLETFVHDLRRARPTVFISVPRLWLKFQQGVFARLPPKTLDRLLAIPIFGRIVAHRVLKSLGLDAVLQAGSGSAPLPAELIRWYRRLGLRLFEGYAMSEDSSYSHGSNERFGEPGFVGVAMPGVQVRIAPDGEILIKSPGQFSGYYKQPELTAAAFTPDGFFHTGDRGELRHDGMLKITGRTKELFKTAKGKYVAPAPIENLINAHPMVELSLVSGVGQPAAYTMVVLADQWRTRLSDSAVKGEVEREMGQLLDRVNEQLADYEQLRMVVLLREAWSVENGLLTPTLKVKRGAIEREVAPVVASWYETGARVVWA